VFLNAPKGKSPWKRMAANESEFWLLAMQKGNYIDTLGGFVADGGSLGRKFKGANTCKFLRL
jgi:hypothetical protein